jgi:hypothetical protein
MSNDDNFGTGQFSWYDVLFVPASGAYPWRTVAEGLETLDKAKSVISDERTKNLYGRYEIIEVTTTRRRVCK